MNTAQKEAIKYAIWNAEDNLDRYQLAEKQAPRSKTGNGELFTDVIADLKKQIAALKEGL